MKPYRASGKIPLVGYFAMSVAAIVGGSAIGGLTHFISRLFYLIILFPIGMGLAGLFVMAIGITSGKVRNPLVAGLFGLLTGFSIYGAMNYGEYLQLQESIRSEIKQDAALKDADPNRIISEFLKSETNSDGFLGFIKYRAKQGVSIGKIGRSGNNIGEVGTWIYWSIELLIIQLMIIFGSIGTAKNPFCESSNEWYKDEEPIGRVSADAASNFLELVNVSRYAEAGALIGDMAEVPTVDSLVVSKQVSPQDPHADIFLKVGRIKFDDKGNVETNDVISGVVSAPEYDAFQRSIAQPPSTL